MAGETKLGTVDYCVWAFLLSLSLCIGFYFAWAEHHRKRRSQGGETKEFLLGGRQMGAIPVACSLMASFFSAITLLGTPNEVYQYGVMYWFIGIGYVFNILISLVFFVPVFYNMDITSSYQYLGLRFGVVNQIFGAVAFILQMAPYMGIVLYGPCLALGLVIEVNIWIIITCMAVICTIYTSIGGLKAVVWTDVLQLVMMFTGMAAIIVKGAIDSGGFNNVWQIAYSQGRMDLNFSFDPRVRHSFWGMIIGGTTLWVGIYGINQTMIQRSLSVKSLKQSQLSYLINLPGMNLLLLVVILCGFVIFAAFVDCDPLKTGEISKTDQLVPLFVSRFLTQYPGVSGIFVAGIFSGGLSTMSSGLNSLAAVTLHDIILIKYKKLSDRHAAIVSKLLVVAYGVLTMFFAYLSSLTDKILQVALGLFGMLSGPVLGVFTMGMFIPMSNAKGAIAGHIVGQIFIFWMGFGSYAVDIKHPGLALQNKNCTGRGYSSFPRQTEITANNQTLSGLDNFYAVSYIWYTLIGWAVVLSVGLPISYFTRSKPPHKVEAQFITPLLRNFWRSHLTENVVTSCCYDCHPQVHDVPSTVNISSL